MKLAPEQYRTIDSVQRATAIPRRPPTRPPKVVQGVTTQAMVVPVVSRKEWDSDTK